MNKLKDLRENDKTESNEKSWTKDMIVFTLEYYSDTILGYLRYAGHTGYLHRQRVKEKRSSLLARAVWIKRFFIAPSIFPITLPVYSFKTCIILRLKNHHRTIKRQSVTSTQLREDRG